MARAKVSTTKAGKVRTQRAAQDVTSRIEGPHRGKSPKSVGPQTQTEKDALRGIPGKGKVKSVGPDERVESGAVGAPGSVKVVGGGNFEDRLAAQGGELRNPASRQSGSVKQVGPQSRDLTKLTERAMPAPQTQQARFAPKSGRRLDKGVRLLVGGVGRAHTWSKFAGTPGTQGGGLKKVFATNSLLINGRTRTFKAEPFDPRRDLVTPNKNRAIVPGS